MRPNIRKMVIEVALSFDGKFSSQDVLNKLRAMEYPHVPGIYQISGVLSHDGRIAKREKVTYTPTTGNSNTSKCRLYEKKVKSG